MHRYKSAYYRMCIKSMDILDEIEELMEIEDINEETMQKLVKIAYEIKVMHIEAEEEIIRDKKRKII